MSSFVAQRFLRTLVTFTIVSLILVPVGTLAVVAEGALETPSDPTSGRGSANDGAELAMAASPKDGNGSGTFDEPHVPVSSVLDSEAPTIVSWSEIDNNESMMSAIEINFSEAMNRTATSISVAGMEGSVSCGGDQATFTRTSAFAGNKSCLVTVNGKDLAGNVLTSVQWIFHTANVGTVEGTVLDGGGQPLGDTLVILAPMSSASMSCTNRMALSVSSLLGTTRTTTTDGSGHYAFHGVYGGRYTLVVSKDNYTTQRSTFTLDSSHVASGGITLDRVLATSAKGDNTPLILVSGMVIGAMVLVAVLMVRKRRSVTP